VLAQPALGGGQDGRVQALVTGTAAPSLRRRAFPGFWCAAPARRLGPGACDAASLPI